MPFFVELFSPTDFNFSLEHSYVKFVQKVFIVPGSIFQNLDLILGRLIVVYCPLKPFKNDNHLRIVSTVWPVVKSFVEVLFAK